MNVFQHREKIIRLHLTCLNCFKSFLDSIFIKENPLRFLKEYHKNSEFKLFLTWL